jgi:CYTH domain-containing protein
MDKTYRNELRRLFLLEHLPEPMTRADAHLQLFDNYIHETRLRLRSIRIPETREWTWILQQRFAVDEDSAHWKIAEIYLNETEYHTFETFEGTEIRKNRYFYESDGKRIEIDVFLGKLWGLNLARVCFETIEELRDFAFPFSVLEVTSDKFFNGENLVEQTFAEVQAEVARIVETRHSTDTLIREIAKENE